jgi:hypothetical protein
MISVPYIPADCIERDAEALLNEFAQPRRLRIAPPIPIEDVLEKHLKLGIEFDDMHARLGVPRRGLGLFPNIFGGMFFRDRRIVIDESLDPDEHPSMEGRYRSTAAHEGGGHWRLHRHLFLRMGETPIVCRSNQRYDRVEWQANYYASCLLMPRSLVYAAWQVLGRRAVVEHAVRDMAMRFLVSRIAMRIRLEKLGLIAAEPAQHAHTA